MVQPAPLGPDPLVPHLGRPARGAPVRTPSGRLDDSSRVAPVHGHVHRVAPLPVPVEARGRPRVPGVPAATLRARKSSSRSMVSPRCGWAGAGERSRNPDRVTSSVERNQCRPPAALFRRTARPGRLAGHLRRTGSIRSALSPTCRRQHPARTGDFSCGTRFPPAGRPPRGGRRDDPLPRTVVRPESKAPAAHHSLAGWETAGPGIPPGTAPAAAEETIRKTENCRVLPPGPE